MTLKNCSTVDLPEQDSLTAERFFTDSLGNKFMCEYRYAPYSTLPGTDYESKGEHEHYIAICSIIAYKGNRKSTIASNIKAIYSPVECSADSPKLWLKRLYDIQNKKK